MIGLNDLFAKVFINYRYTIDEALYMYEKAATSDLIYLANEIRKKLHSFNRVGWMIDRNVNITNICLSQCRFCNFCRVKKDADSYVTTIDEYKQKIEELFSLGGNQLLLQGGMHPDFGLDFYCDLFSRLKSLYPTLKLHALGPPEIVYIANKDKISYKRVLEKLIESGLDSLPGAGAEILSDRVRNEISPAKATTTEWLEVMKEAHILNIPTSATMMFGHIETNEERIQHILHIRDLQNQKPEKSFGFLSFISWPFQDEHTVLKTKYGISNSVTSEDYIRMIAISRILLYNVPTIQASWLTVGKAVAQVCLHAGANDFGSIMIEENVVSSAGASHSFDRNGIQQAIRDAGFIPYQRNQKFETVG